MTYRPSGHGLLDLYGCDGTLLRDEARLKTILETAARAAHAAILGSRFHTFGGGGGGGGVTGVLLLAESHISIHTWPEHRFAAIDAFLCGDMQLEQVRQSLCRDMQPQRTSWRVEKRGTELAAQMLV